MRSMPMPVSTCLDGSSDKLAVFFAVVLNENQIPQLDVAGAVAVDAAFMTGDALLIAGRRTAVEMNLAARTAGTGLAHFPKIFFFAEAAYPLGRQAADLGPELLRVIVVQIDGGVKLVFRQTPFFGQQLPGPLDRFGFVVIAERPVAEHFEKRVMVGIAADGFQVVVFAADAQTFLRAGGAHIGQTLLAEERRS